MIIKLKVFFVFLIEMAALPRIGELKIALPEPEPEPIHNFPDPIQENNVHIKSINVKNGNKWGISELMTETKNQESTKKTKIDTKLQPKMVRTAVHTKADLKTAIRSLLRQPAPLVDSEGSPDT